METIYESIVMHYLTHRGDTFICPQFPLKDEKGGSWSAPDFVALKFRKTQGEKNEIQIVEISTAHDLSKLLERVRNREDKWFVRLRPHLANLGFDLNDWNLVVKVFVREERIGVFEKVVAQDVEVHPIESVLRMWKWPW